MRSICFALVTAVAGSAVAEVINPLVPSWRGETGSAFFGWENFTTPFAGPNFPDDPFSMDAQLFNFQSGASIAGSGNLYGSQGLNIHMYGAGAPTEAVLNFTVAGSLINLESVQGFIGDQSQQGDFFAPATSELRYELDLGEMGFIQTWAFTFDMSDYTGAGTDWAFFFRGDNPHISLDAATLDLRNVPAPGAMALLGLAGLRGRRRR